jgi:hypothetical protein
MRTNSWFSHFFPMPVHGHACMLPWRLSLFFSTRRRPSTRKPYLVVDVVVVGLVVLPFLVPEQLQMLLVLRRYSCHVGHTIDDRLRQGVGAAGVAAPLGCGFGGGCPKDRKEERFAKTTGKDKRGRQGFSSRSNELPVSSVNVRTPILSRSLSLFHSLCAVEPRTEL